LAQALLNQVDIRPEGFNVCSLDKLFELNDVKGWNLKRIESVGLYYGTSTDQIQRGL